VSQDSESAEITSVHFRRLRKNEGLGDGLRMRKSGIQNSSSPRCGLIDLIPSLIGNFEGGNYVIMALVRLLFAGKCNEFFTWIFH
jgi:hypothetical protein